MVYGNVVYVVSSSLPVYFQFIVHTPPKRMATNVVL